MFQTMWFSKIISQSNNMKIIQSYWSKPSEETKNKIGRNSGGWLDKHFHYMSWALSCLKFKEFYSDVELYTDAKGKDFLIDKLKLPYTKVENCLDCLNDYNPLIWAVGKIHTYSLQTAPFIHADNDVFIWKKFGEAFETQLLIAQSFSYSYPRLKPLLDSIFKELKFIPSAIRNDYKNENVTDSLCVGIVGGNDIAFIQAFSKKCLEFIDKNLPNLEKIDAKKMVLI